MLGGRIRGGLAAVATFTCLAFGTAPAAAVTITEYEVDEGAAGGDNVPTFIASSPSGRLWFTDVGFDYGVRQMNTLGEPIGEELNEPKDEEPRAPIGDLAFDTDGDLSWGTDNGLGSRPLTITRRANGSIEYLDSEGIRPGEAFLYADGLLYAAFVALDKGNPSGYTVCRFEPESLCFGQDLVDTSLTDLTLDADGRIWAAQPAGDVVRRTNLTRSDFDLAVPMPGGSYPYRVALGPDGNLWVTAFGSEAASFANNAIVRITPAGVRTVFPLPAGRGPTDITAGPDGALWFTEFESNSIGRLTTCGEYKSYPLPEEDALPWGIVTGDDGALWFTESGVGWIGRLMPDPPQGDCPLGPGTGGGDSGSGGPGILADTAAPALGQLNLSRSSFLAAKSGASTSAKRKPAPLGTTVGFSLSESAKVDFTIERSSPGRRLGGKCVKQKPANAGKPRCERWLSLAGSISIDGKPGANSFGFRGRIGGRSLKPGKHRLLGKATDTAGNASAVQSKAFTIIP